SHPTRDQTDAVSLAFVAAVEEELHAEADAEAGQPRLERRADPGAILRKRLDRRAESADARQDQRVAGERDVPIRRDRHARAAPLERFAERVQVARAVVEQRDAQRCAHRGPRSAFADAPAGAGTRPSPRTASSAARKRSISGQGPTVTRSPSPTSGQAGKG